MPKRAIVLSGGGSCGAYQIGVWKALRKLKIGYDIVTGTSVGALNGVMMVQNDYALAHKIWSHLNYNLLFKSFISSNDKNLTNKDIYLKYVDGFLKNGGMNVTNLEKTIANVFDEKKFYNSSIDYGINVFNLSKLQTESLTKETLKPNNIKDYIIASASCYPAFQKKEIHNQNYIDGGYGDNLPINLAIFLGATEIIAVDLEQIGVKKKSIKKDVPITYIRPKNDVGSFLIFDKSQAAKNIKYGYNDTLKEYGKLRGNIFTFYSFGYHYYIKKANKNMKSYLLRLNGSKRTLKNINSLDSMELLGSMLELDDSKIYFIGQYIRKLEKQIQNVPPLNIELIKSKIQQKEIKNLLGSKYIVKYIYNSLKEESKDLDWKLLYSLFYKEFMAAVYLVSME